MAGMALPKMQSMKKGAVPGYAGGGFIANRAGGVTASAAPAADAPAVTTPLSAPPAAAPPAAGQPGLLDRLQTAPGTYFGSGMQAFGQGDILGGVGGVARSVLAVPASLAATALSSGISAARDVVPAAQQLGHGFVPELVSPTNAPPAQAIAPTPSPMVASSPNAPQVPSSPAAGNPAPAPVPVARQEPITVIRGGRVDEGGGQMTRYDLAQLQNMASAQPRISPLESAQRQIVQSYQVMRDAEMREADEAYKKAYTQAAGNPEAIAALRDVHTKAYQGATTRFLHGLQTFAVPQAALMDLERQQASNPAPTYGGAP